MPGKGIEFLNSLLEVGGKPVDEASLFSGFENLTHDDVEYILQAIEEELEISRGFGLELEAEEIAQEKIAIFTLFNRYAPKLIEHGSEPFHTQGKYEHFSSLLIEFAIEMLMDTSLKYYNLDLEEDARSENPRAVSKYNLHVQFTVSRLQRYFYDIGTSNMREKGS